YSWRCRSWVTGQAVAAGAYAHWQTYAVQGCFCMSRTEGKSALAGSYVVEQRFTNSYDLVSCLSPHHKIPSGVPRRRAGWRFLHVERSVLPSLTLGPLLAKSGAGFRRPKLAQGADGEGDGQGKAQLKLPAIHSSPRGLVEPPDAERRISRGHQTGRIASFKKALRSPSPPGPSEEEFSSWLQMPGSLSKASEYDGSPRSDAAPASWHLLLLRGSYDDPNNTEEHISECLQEVLGLPPHSAVEKAQAARRRPVASVASFSGCREAVAKVESLRQLGLVVQVVSAAGVPGIDKASISGASPPQGKYRRCAPESYAELFKSLGGRGGDSSPRSKQNPGQHRGASQRRRFKGYQAIAISIVPQDPVAALFAAERGEVVIQAMKKTSSFSHLVQKHKAKLKFVAGVNKAAKAGDAPAIGRGDASANGRGEAPEDKSQVSGKKTRDRIRTSLRFEHWDEVLQAVTREVKITFARREACQMVRFFVFGFVGNENCKSAKEKDEIYYEALGTKTQVQDLWDIWEKLDADSSGRCDVNEFRGFAEGHINQLKLGVAPVDAVRQQGLPSWANIRIPEDGLKFTARLCSGLEKLLLGIKSSFIIEDMMRLIWPSAQIPHLIEMRRWCTDFANVKDKHRMPTPPLLPEADLNGLCSVFRWIDSDGGGELSVQELVATGMIMESKAQQFVKSCDHDNSGTLDMLEFCEMMCPNGFQAHDKAVSATTALGARIIFDDRSQSWRPVADPNLDSEDE
ncbi:unnamed protein product, partial [Polarella glacialis]